MLYTFYFYDGTPTRERRPRKSANDGIIEENINFDTDALALIYAAETVAEMNNDDFDYEFNDEQEALDYLDDIDIGSGAAFLFGLKAGGTFIYGDDSFLYDIDEDLNVNEAILNELDEVLKDPAFKEIIDLINSKYPHNDVKISKQSVSDDYVDLSIEFDMIDDIDDDMFHEDERYIKDTAVEDLAENVEEYFLKNISVGEDGIYACSNSDCKIFVEVIDNFFRGDPKIYREYTPATMYNSFGDPGDPEEYDYEIEGELVITLRIRLTKNI